MRHLSDSLIIKAADAGVAGDRLVVQYVAAVADGVDRDGPNEALFDGEAGGAACRGGAAAEQTAEKERLLGREGPYCKLKTYLLYCMVIFEGPAPTPKLADVLRHGPA